MKTQMSLSAQHTCGLFLALLLGYLFGGVPVAPSASPLPGDPDIQPTAEVNPAPLTPRPFVTLPGVWLVKLHLYRSNPPVIETITRLEQGRFSALHAGEYQIQILDSASQILFEESFDVSFVWGEPLREREDVKLYLVLPDLQDAKSLRVETPQGDVDYEFPSR